MKKYLPSFQVYQTLGSGLQLVRKNGLVLHAAVLLQAGKETRGGGGAVAPRGRALVPAGAREGERPGAGAREGAREGGGPERCE